MKSAMLITISFLSGCAASDIKSDAYVEHGYIASEPVRIPSCNPFYADSLMEWATALEQLTHHARKATASVDAMGNVRCTSSEHAASMSGSR